MILCEYNQIQTALRRGHDLSNFTLTLHRGDSLALLGNNGSGKSLLGALLTGSIPVASGTFRHARKPALVSFERINEIIEEDRIEADITEETFLNPGLTCEELILRESGAETVPPSFFEKFSLSAQRGEAIRHLSTGEIGKALIVAALLAQPDLLILDEPFDGLDINSRKLLAEMINSLIGHERALLLIINRLEEIPESIHQIALIEQNTIIQQGPREEMLSSGALQRLLFMDHNIPEELPGEHRVGPSKVDIEGNLFSLKNVTVAYDDKKVLNQINWDLKPGEHWQISGPNGCGKSTLLSLLSGDHTQAYGNDITLFGFKRGSGESIWDIKKEVGLVSTLFQRNYRVPGSVLSVILSGFYDSIGLYTQTNTIEETEARKWLKIIGMKDWEKRPFNMLSYGEKRMVLIARAMVKRPSLLILDEPCLGLDPLNRRLVLKLVDIIGSTSGTSILYVTHHQEDRVPCIKNLITFVPAETGGFALHFNKD